MAHLLYIHTKLIFPDCMLYDPSIFCTSYNSFVQTIKIIKKSVFCSRIHEVDRKVTFFYVLVVQGGVGIAKTGYGLDGPQVRFLAVQDFFFSAASRPTSGPHPAFYPMGTGSSFPGGKAAWA
jgi:hypothetical protein